MCQETKTSSTLRIMRFLFIWLAVAFAYWGTTACFKWCLVTNSSQRESPRMHNTALNITLSYSVCICICLSANLHVSWVKTNCTYCDKVRLPSSAHCTVRLIFHWADEMRAVRGGVHLHCCMQWMHSCLWTVQTVLNHTCWHSESLIQTPGSWAADIQHNISFPSLIFTFFVKLQEKISVSVVSPEENWNHMPLYSTSCLNVFLCVQRQTVRSFVLLVS